MGNNLITEVIKHTVNEITNDIQTSMNNTKEFIFRRVLLYLIAMFFIIILCLVILKIIN